MDVKFSIITPSFNQGEYIEDAIKSVQNQSNVEIEHIIIDGGSTDKTLSILKNYKNLTWISEKDRGQTHALNKGLKLATGNIIGWLNADDFYENNVFEKIFKNIKKKEIDIVYGNFFYVNKKKKKLKKRISKKYFFLPKRIISLFVCFIPSVTFFIKKEKIKNIYFDEKANFTMDKDLFANLLFKRLKVRKINYTIGNMRLHENNRLENKKDEKSNKIRLSEGLNLFNKFSKIKLPDNNFGIFIYKILQKKILILNFISNLFLK